MIFLVLPLKIVRWWIVCKSNFTHRPTAPAKPPDCQTPQVTESICDTKFSLSDLWHPFQRSAQEASAPGAFWQTKEQELHYWKNIECQKAPMTQT
ncbi:hypothetical protein ACFX1S_019796 [Malus domestica]